MKNNKDVILNLLASAAAAIEAAYSMLEEEKNEDHETKCTHPKDRRKDISTMGNPRWQCLDCGDINEEVKT